MTRRRQQIETLPDGRLIDRAAERDYLAQLDARESERRPRVRRLSTRPGPDLLPVMVR